MEHLTRRNLLLFSALGVFTLACSGGGTPQTPQTPKTEASGPALERIQHRGVLVVGMDLGEGEAGTPPMYFKNAQGQPDGFDYEVAKWMAMAVGVPEVKLVHGRYSELPELLRASKEIDVVISGYAPAPMPGLSWSDSYLDYGLALIVPADSPVRALQQLSGQPVGVFADPAAKAEVLRLLPDAASVVEMDDGYLDALTAGKIAGFFYDYPYAAAEIKAWAATHPRQANAFRFARYNLNEMYYAVAVRDSEPELLAVVNKGIDRFTSSDKYGEAIRRFLSGGAAVALAPSSTTGHTVTVRAGDTLSLIAQRELNDKNRWKDIWNLNRDRLASPHLIEAGDVLRLP